uniref:Flavoprotein n=2 Tax=Wuchereria bancrofti TaxID=6293 RepID=A0A1I8EUE0_WUCBA
MDEPYLRKPRIVYRTGVPNPLTLDQYSAVLDKVEKNRNLVCTNGPMYRPDGGTIVVYDCALYPRGTLNDDQVRRTFRVDGYRWGNSKGVHNLSNGLQKRYNLLYCKNDPHGDDRFIRCEYSREPCGLVLFHYIGDHVIAAQISDNAPHGNAKRTNQPFLRTLPIILQEVKEQSIMNNNAVEIYDRLTEQSIYDQCASSSRVTPRRLRNKEQVRNVMKSFRQKLARNSLYINPRPTTLYVTEQEASALGRRVLRRSNTELNRNQEVVESGVFEQEGMPDGQPHVIVKKARVEDDSESNYAPIDVTTVDTQNIKTRVPYGPDHSFVRQGGKFHLLIGITGSVASIKLSELITELRKNSPEEKLVIRIVATDAARTFIDESGFDIPIYNDMDEWNMWKKRGDPVLHIELRKWSDAMLIAPLDANSMAKIANGICDNVLLSIVRAWDPRKPLYYAPAMNVAMWENPLTYQHRKVLKELLRYKEIPPIEKELMCGDTGLGAMATVQMIASIVASEVKNRFAVYSDNSSL